MRAVHQTVPFGESGAENPKPSWRSTSNSLDIGPATAGPSSFERFSATSYSDVTYARRESTKTISLRMGKPGGVCHIASGKPSF